MKSLLELKPWRVIEINREAIGLRGFIVIDVHEHGFACGGVRMRAEVTPDEIANLAREMSLKYRFLKIRKDGAKAGIVAPIDSPPARKAELCRAFGEEARDILHSGLYTPGEDMGVGHAELDQIMLGAGFPIGPKQTPAEFYTALTAAICFEEYCRWHKLDSSEMRVSIEGYGKVGSGAARLLAANGARLVGLSTAQGAVYRSGGIDVNQIESLRRQHGDALVHHIPDAEQLPREELLSRPTDFFFPGAQPDSIHAGNVAKVKARCLISIANIAAEPAIEDALDGFGIDYFPGFVANCGGILSYYLREQDFKVDELEAFIRSGFAQKIRYLIVRASRAGDASIAATARQIAAENARVLLRERNTLDKLLDVRRYGWLLYRNAGRFGLRNLMLPYAQQYMRTQLFQQ